jgi:hypothetical protein
LVSQKSGVVPLLMSVLSGFQDSELDRVLVSVIDSAVKAPESPWWLPEAIRLLVVRRGWHDWGSEMWRRDLASGDLKKEWTLVARDLGLPIASPARAAARTNGDSD